MDFHAAGHQYPRGHQAREPMPHPARPSQGGLSLYHEIADTLFPQADPVFDDAAALDPAMDMLDAQPAVREGLIRHVLLPRQLLAAWFLGRHEDLSLGERERQKAQILQQPAPSGQGIRGRLGDALVVDTPCRGRAEEKDREQGIDQQDIFYRMVLFLAAITCGLLSKVLG
jgi:hypothetical protein